LFEDESTTLAFTHGLVELSANSLSLLFSGLASGVLISLVGSLKLSPRDAALVVLIK
jgi:hypothetical protein